MLKAAESDPLNSRAQLSEIAVSQIRGNSRATIDSKLK